MSFWNSKQMSQIRYKMQLKLPVSAIQQGDYILKGGH